MFLNLVRTYDPRGILGWAGADNQDAAFLPSSLVMMLLLVVLLVCALHFE